MKVIESARVLYRSLGFEMNSRTASVVALHR